MSALLQSLEKSGLPFRYECKNGVETYSITHLCGAKCKSTGEPCRQSVGAQGERCRFHGGRSTGPKTAAGRAAIADANRRRKGTRYKLPKMAPTVAPVYLTPAQKIQRDADRELNRRQTAAPPDATKATGADLLAQLQSMTPESFDEMASADRNALILALLG